MMGSNGETNEGRPCSDAGNSVFVAIGKNVKKGKSLLSWTLNDFPTRKIYILHVHQPMTLLSLMQEGKMVTTSKLKQQAVKVLQDLQRQKMNKLLDHYCEFVSKQQKKEVGKLWIEMSNVEEGIVTLITRQEITWFAMGAAEKYYSKQDENLSQIKSRKAVFVCRQAPAYCHMWFVCNGCLIHTKSANIGSISGSLVSASPAISGGKSSVHKKIEDKCDNVNDLQILEHQVQQVKKMNVSFVSMTSMAIEMKGNSLLSFSSEKSGENPHLRSLGPVDIFNGEEIGLDHHKLEQAAINAENKKQLAFEESLRRWRAEEDALEALQKVQQMAKASENLYIEEKCQRKELEESLSTQMHVIEKLKNQHEEFLTELQLTKNQQRALENHLTESCHLQEELEAKIIQAVQLMIIFKEKRDELQKEHHTAITEANELKKSLKEDCSAQFFEFFFLDIVEATQNFDLSLKIHEGRSGVSYCGNLRHSKVVIKMLSLSNFQSDEDFLCQVQVLSRVRHPHLVTLMGTCSESRCVIYEYLDKGSLEDHLRYEARTSVLPWHFRIRIEEEICSALVFLHSNSSSLVHGNLTTTNILLDANFVSKIADFGTSFLISNNGNPHTDLKLVGEDVEEVSAYMDPNYIANGEVAPECDIYSYGIILLRLLTGKPATSILKDVEFSLQSGSLDTMLDSSAGKWPLEQTIELASLALRCCDMQRLNRPDLVSDMWTAIRRMRDLCNSPSSSPTPTLGCLAPKRQLRIPSHFICLIFQEMMKDPYVAADGFTYEGDAIKEWLKGGHKTSPMTNLPLQHCDLLPNNALYYAIQEWQQQQPS